MIKFRIIIIWGSVVTGKKNNNHEKVALDLRVSKENIDIEKTQNMDIEKTNKISILRRQRKYRYWEDKENIDIEKTNNYVDTEKTKKYRYWEDNKISILKRQIKYWY